MANQSDHGNRMSMQRRVNSLNALILSLILGGLAILLLLSTLGTMAVASAPQRENMSSDSTREPSNSTAPPTTTTVHVTKTVEPVHPDTGEVVEVGKQYVNQPRLTTRNRKDCSLVNDTVTTDYLTVTKRHSQLESPSGITLVDVIEVEWRKSPTGNIEEVYFFANGLGLVAWGVGELEAAISELPQGREPLNPDLWGCT